MRLQFLLLVLVLLILSPILGEFLQQLQDFLLQQDSLSLREVHVPNVVVKSQAPLLQLNRYFLFLYVVHPHVGGKFHQGIPLLYDCYVILNQTHTHLLDDARLA